MLLHPRLAAPALMPPSAYNGGDRSPEDSSQDRRETDGGPDHANSQMAKDGMRIRAGMLVAARRARAMPSAPFVPDGKLLTVKQVAQLIQVSTATVYALCERGELAHSRVMNAIRVAPHDVQRFVARSRR